MCHMNLDRNTGILQFEGGIISPSLRLEQFLSQKYVDRPQATGVNQGRITYFATLEPGIKVSVVFDERLAREVYIQIGELEAHDFLAPLEPVMIARHNKWLANCLGMPAYSLDWGVVSSGKSGITGEPEIAIVYK